MWAIALKDQALWTLRTLWQNNLVRYDFGEIGQADDKNFRFGTVSPSNSTFQVFRSEIAQFTESQFCLLPSRFAHNHTEPEIIVTKFDE